MNDFFHFLTNIKANWFDFVTVGFICYGVLEGRKKGMSQIMLNVCQWLLVVVVASLAYKPLGEFITEITGIQLLFTYLISYVWIAVFICLIFAYIRTRTKGQIVSVDFFGSSEYTLGMLGGAVKSLCVLLVLLAVVNARHYTSAELNRSKAFQKQWFEGVSFPTYGGLRQSIFEKSATGVFTRNYLEGQLIVPTRVGQREPSNIAARPLETGPSVLLGVGQNY